MLTYGFWFYHELQDLVGTRPAKHRGDNGDSYIELVTPHGILEAKTSSYRLELFRQNPRCVSCHRIGTLWMLEAHHRGEPPHLNLYHVEDGEVKEWKNLSRDGLVMMTKDHIIPKSRGGLTTISNLQTMCSICNGKKGNTLNYLNGVNVSPISPTHNRLLVEGEMRCLSGKLHLL